MDFLDVQYLSPWFIGVLTPTFRARKMSLDGISPNNEV
jgi:hypothetical protein